MNLSKTKYTNACVCKKMLWLDTYKSEVKGAIDLNSVMDNGNLVHDVARDILGDHITIEFNNDLKVMVDDTKKAMKQENVVICEASFIYKNNFCSVDILEKNKDSYNIYEVKGSTKEKDIFLTDISFQYYVLKNLGINVQKYYLVHLNSSYYRHGELELDKLFTKIDVTDEIKKLENVVANNIESINKAMESKEEPDIDIGIKCFNPYNCPYFTYCTSSLEKPNVFSINRLQTKKKLEYYKNKLITFKDLKDVEMNPKFKMQIEYELDNKEDYINYDNIKSFLDTLTYPLYYLDFETFQLPVPAFDNINPYMKIPFQYSLHYKEGENGELLHKEFLGTTPDPRRELALQLISDIPRDVCVLAYNMGFEKSVIKNLAFIFPDLREHLMNIHDNIKDLMVPFANKDYYNKAMQGSYSIKYVLPALFPNDESLDYHNLELVHNGSEAMSFYNTLFDKTKEEQEYIRDRLLKYCYLDTYAMVKVHDKLIEVVEKKNG
ncbi:MAG: DUF2779 domain-containing protein [Bacilli bacterium]|nr:DUF2779 domain-containing protein [Bacilli bacterium]